MVLKDLLELPSQQVTGVRWGMLDGSLVCIVLGEGWEKHQADFVLCRFGSVPLCLDGSVGFLLLF